MSLYKRYTGFFRDLYENGYRAEIWQESDVEFVQEGITFTANAIEIEWQKQDKLKPLRSSAATIEILSDSDRKFVDLYTVAVKTVRLDIYRNDSLYWSGTIDTELYEEPYYTEKGYAVTLTFSDFAVLKRIKWDGRGFRTMEEVLSTCIDAAGISYNSVIKHISTQLYSFDNEDVFHSVSVLGDNFYNEDGEADNLSDVLQHLLTPFTAHIQQKGGSIHVFDINRLMEEDAISVKWSRHDSLLSVDKIYNNASITLSAYEQTEIMSAEMGVEDFPVPSSDSGILFVTDLDNPAAGFYINFDATKDSVFEIKEGTGAKFFVINPVYSGGNDHGVAYTCRRLDSSFLNPASSCMNGGVHVRGELFRVKYRPYLGYVSYRRSEYKLKITLDFLFDVRNNPFEPSSSGNEEGNFERFTQWCNFAYVPFTLTLRDGDGRALYHYRNKNVMESDRYDLSGSWVQGEPSWGDSYLCYYNESDRKSSTGLGGWATNKQCIGYYRGDLPGTITKRGEGEYIDLPPSAGWLDMRIGEGIFQFDYKREEKDIYSRTRWVLYKGIHIDLVDKYGNALGLKDQIYNAWLERDAEEDYSVKTHIGTMRKASPSARGVIFSTATHDMIEEVYRNGYTAGLEQLAIGTIYSQFASRKNMLSGTIRLIPDTLVYSDNNTEGKYMSVSEVQDLRNAVSKISIVEIDTDNYEGVEFKD